MSPDPSSTVSRCAGLKIAPTDAALKSGLEDVTRAQESASMGGGNPFASLFGPESLLKLAAHPTFGQYLADPDFQAKWRMIQTNPNALQGMLQVSE
jgi:hypothetical protein